MQPENMPNPDHPTIANSFAESLQQIGSAFETLGRSLTDLLRDMPVPVFNPESRPRPPERSGIYLTFHDSGGPRHMPPIYRNPVRDINFDGLFDDLERHMDRLPGGPPPLPSVRPPWDMSPDVGDMSSEGNLSRWVAGSSPYHYTVTNREAIRTEIPFDHPNARCVFRPETPDSMGILTNLDESLDTSSDLWQDSSCRGTVPDTDESGRTPNMPRRRNRQMCECGCGQMTETGRFLRGHATRHRWNLIKAAEAGRGLQTNGRYNDATDVRTELNARKWAMPSGRRSFGVEFELTSPVDAMTIVSALRAAKVKVQDPRGYLSVTDIPEWTVKTDSSIRPTVRGHRGFEVVSPPLRGKRGENELRKVLKVLNALGCSVNVSCGTHVHVGASDLSVDGIKRVVKGYASAQHAINGMMPGSRRNLHYAKAWTPVELSRLDGQTTVQGLQYVADRYKTVNLKPYPRIGTVEFRQHGGTLNATKILAWVDFARKLVESAGKSKVGLTLERVDLPTILTTVNVPVASRSYLLSRAA